MLALKQYEGVPHTTVHLEGNATMRAYAALRRSEYEAVAETYYLKGKASIRLRPLGVLVAQTCY